ncbi:MAG: prepilin-type N-terminal cleavage/methylation domain-containing protein [Phycisphaerae bacterium]
MKQANRKAYTLVEAMAALLVMGIVVSGVVVTITNCLETMIDMRLENNAVDLARENMEYILSKNDAYEFYDSGVDEFNPDLNWEIGFEVATYPNTSDMWVRAFSTSGYYRTDGEYKTIEFESWIVRLSDEQQQQYKEQATAEQQMLDDVADAVSEAQAEKDTAEEETDTGSVEPADNSELQELLDGEFGDILRNFGIGQ